MKKSILLLPLLLLAAACAQKSIEINYNVLPGSGLYFPEEGAYADLATGKAVSFEWGPAMAEDNGYVSYEVLFDRVGGDFSHPVGRVAGQINGSRNYVSIPAKTLSKIARAAGIGIYSTGTLQWSVRASKGMGGVIYPTPRRINLRTMNSMDPLPKRVDLGGTAMEAQLKMTPSRGIDGSGEAEGVFEAFCKVSSGTFTIVDNLGRYYALASGGTITSSATAVETSLPASPSVRWLQLDFDSMTWWEKSVVKVTYYAAAWVGQMISKETEMSYAGKGVWQLLDYPNTVSDNDVKDGRHRFNMSLSDGTAVYLGTEATLGIGYTTDYLRVNLYTDETVGNKDWDKTYDFLEADCGRPFDVYLYMNADNAAGSWWHEYNFK